MNKKLFLKYTIFLSGGASQIPESSAFCGGGAFLPRVFFLFRHDK